MMTVKEKIAKYYKKGYYTLAHLEVLCRAGVITKEYLSEIIKGV